jgi:hypothetical protein
VASKQKVKGVKHNKKAGKAVAAKGHRLLLRLRLYNIGQLQHAIRYLGVS